MSYNIQTPKAQGSFSLKWVILSSPRYLSCCKFWNSRQPDDMPMHCPQAFPTQPRVFQSTGSQIWLLLWAFFKCPKHSEDQAPEFNWEARDSPRTTDSCYEYRRELHGGLTGQSPTSDLPLSQLPALSPATQAPPNISRPFPWPLAPFFTLNGWLWKHPFSLEETPTTAQRVSAVFQILGYWVFNNTVWASPTMQCLSILRNQKIFSNSVRIRSS